MSENYLNQILNARVYDVAIETPLAREENNTHLMLILLSPLTEITLLKFLISFFIKSKFDIEF